LFQPADERNEPKHLDSSDGRYGLEIIFFNKTRLAGFCLVEDHALEFQAGAFEFPCREQGMIDRSEPWPRHQDDRQPE